MVCTLFDGGRTRGAVGRARGRGCVAWFCGTGSSIVCWAEAAPPQITKTVIAEPKRYTPQAAARPESHNFNSFIIRSKLYRRIGAEAELITAGQHPHRLLSSLKRHQPLALAQEKRKVNNNFEQLFVIA